MKTSQNQSGQGYYILPPAELLVGTKAPDNNKQTLGSTKLKIQQLNYLQDILIMI